MIVDIEFDTAKLAKLCNSARKLRGKYGPRMADLIQRRLADLDAAECLEVMRTLPGRCHELAGNLKGRLAIDLVHPDRLVFAPNHEPLPSHDHGGLDWAHVTKIIVVGIGDYH